MALIIAIGRNFGKAAGLLHGEPMLDVDWKKFKSEVTDLVVAGLHLRPYFTGEGRGIYEDRAEESWVIIAQDPEPDQMPHLGMKLQHLSSWYTQDSIAVTVGNTVFMGPKGLVNIGS